MLAALLLVFVLPQQQSACADVEVCRAQALIAHAKQDHEEFHHLAWAAYRKGRQNDADLMLLVARAQSLSGRPGDALVMIERIAALGTARPEVETDPDFARVRALPRWQDVRERLSGLPSSASPSTAPSTVTPSPTGTPPRPTGSTTTATTPRPAGSSAIPSGSTSVPPPSPTEPVAATPKPPAPPAGEASLPKDPPSAGTPAATSSNTGAAGKVAEPAPRGGAAAPLRFTTLLTPTALVYDGVSKRFIMGDRQSRRVAVVDEHSGQVSTLVGAQGALGEVAGVAIDPQQGDLWVVSTEGGASTLHKMQLISGRVLSTVTLAGVTDPVVALAFVRGAGLVLADAGGSLWRVLPSGRSERLGALEYVPRAIAADAAGRLYVAGGGRRLGHFALSPALRRIGVVELDEGFPVDQPFVVRGDRLHAIVRTGAEYEIRTMKLK